MFAFVLIIGVLTGCKDSVVPPSGNISVKIDLADISCTEAWVVLNLEGFSLPANVTLKADSLVMYFTIARADTELYFNNLLPGRSYDFEATVNLINSNKVTGQTLDTTSHNFTWQSWEFGQTSSNVLWDVAIINENNIWAVGEFYLRDSTGEISKPYNAVHWDGHNWEMKILSYVTNGDSSYGGIKSIIAFNENDIWFGPGNLIHYKNGIFIPVHVVDDFHSAIHKMWGTSSNNFYVCGQEGKIGHYDGYNWEKIETGTNLNINDIYGAYNKKTKDYELLAIASNMYVSYDKEILKISGNKAEKINNNYIGLHTLSGLWFIPERVYYAIGDGFYRKRNLNDPQWDNSIMQISRCYTYKIKGTGFNNIISAGSFGEILHFNGSNWKNLWNETKLANGEYFALDIKNNLVCLVGFNGSKARILLGKRN